MDFPSPAAGEHRDYGRPQSNEQPRSEVPMNRTRHINHNGNSVLVPFLIFLIGLGGTYRAWPFLSPIERIPQLLLLTILTLPIFFAAFFPRFFFKHHTVFVNTSRLALVLSPSSKRLITKLVNADGSLGRRWAQTNPLGILGILIFASRSLVFYASSIGIHMDFLSTLAVQLLLAIASYTTEPELCKMNLAKSALSLFTPIHYILNSAWAVVVPFPYIPTPPAEVTDPGTSLTAIIIMIKVISLLTPVIQSAYRAAADYRYRCQEEGIFHGMQDQEDEIFYDEVYDPVLNNLFPVILCRRNERARRYSTDNDTINFIEREPPLEARLVIAFNRLRKYPIHACWLAVVGTCSLWAGSYSLACYMCSSA